MNDYLEPYEDMSAYSFAVMYIFYRLFVFDAK